MQHASQTIGAIAGALAKAQVELLNPEKSLTATIPSPESGRVSATSAMPPSRVDWRSCERVLAGTRSQPCRPPPSTMTPG
jgi:hypothetical protein